MATDRKLRVLFINDTARNGGPGRCLFTILKFLDPARIHRSVLLPRPGAISELIREGGVAEDVSFEPDLVENPFEPSDRPMDRSDFGAPAWLRAGRLGVNVGRATLGFFRLASRIRNARYDLLYCNGTTADFAGGALAKLTTVPALWHVRYSSIPRPLVPVHRALATSRGVSRIVCVSAASAALFPADARKVSVIHDAIDTSEFDPACVPGTLREELGLSSDGVVFGAHGRVLRRKGFIELIQAAKLVLGELHEHEREKVRFVILGDTPADFRPDHVEECRALARDLGISSHVAFLGFRNDVKGAVLGFDVSVVPSVYEDPLPRSVMESMALARPVISFDVGGIGEMVRDGVTGALVDGRPPDVGALARTMVRYFRSAELRRVQGEAGRARVVECFGGAAHGRAIQREIELAVSPTP